MAQQLGNYLYDTINTLDGDFEVALTRTTNLLSGEVQLTAKILRYMGCKKDVVVPSAVNGYTVTEIAENAFMHNESMERIRFSNTITVIGSNAFEGCTNLMTVWMVEAFCKTVSRVMWIGDNAFKDCYNLTNVIFRNKDIYTHAGPGYQFFNCKNLKRLDASFLYVREHTFSGCSVLNKIYIAPDGFLEYKALNNVPALTCVQFLGNINMDYMSKRVLKQIAKLSIVCPANSNVADLIYTGANIQLV